MSNPFHDSLKPFRGRYVRVVGTNGEAYEGWVERIHYHDRHVVLRDATRLDDGADVGRVMVAHADELVVVDPETWIERVALEAIDPSPYHAAAFDVAQNRGYINQVRDRSFVGSFPVVRPLAEGGYEVVEGHKRLWVAREAGLDSHPVEVVDVDDWTAAERFVVDHTVVDIQEVVRFPGIDI